MRPIPHRWPLASQLPAQMLPLMAPAMFATFATFITFIIFIIFDAFTPAREVPSVLALGGILLVRPDTGGRAICRTVPLVVGLARRDHGTVRPASLSGGPLPRIGGTPDTVLHE